MAEYFAVCRATGERISEFNKRLSDLCDKYHIADAQLHAVGGRLVVMLSTGVDFATDDDVVSGVAEEIGDPIITGVGIKCHLVSLMQEETDKDQTPGEIYASPRNIEKRLRRAFRQGGETVTEVQVAQCDSFRWVECPVSDSKQPTPAALLPIKEGYVLVLQVHEDELEGEDEGDLPAGDETNEGVIDPEVIKGEDA